MVKWSSRNSSKLFKTLLEELNSQQWEFDARQWIESHPAIQRYLPPQAAVAEALTLSEASDSPGAVRVSSSLAEGFVEGATLLARVRDRDGVEDAEYRWQQRAADGGWGDVGSGRRFALNFDSDGALHVLATYTQRNGSQETAQSEINVADVDRPGRLRLASSSEEGFVSGATVTATVRDPDGVDSVAFQWRIRGDDGQWQDIDGASAASLTLDNATAGHRLRVIATYTDGQGHESTIGRSFTVQAALAPEPPAPPPVEPAPPAVPPEPPPPPAAGPPAPEPPAPPPPAPPPPAPSPNSPGVLTVTSANGFAEGAIVTANVIDADGLGPVSYQWQKRAANSTWQNISGATGKNYTIGFADGGGDLRVLANYTDGAGHGEALQFAFKPVDVDRPGDITVTSSSAQGFVIGATITAHVSDPDGVGAVTYQWASKAANGQWQDIGGATGQSYTLTANDAGKEIDVTAKYVDLQGHNSTVVDPFVVAAPPPPPPPPPPAPEPPPSSGHGEPNLLLGVNLAGAEFGNARPGTYGVDYIYPNHAEIDYYAGKGVEVIRLPFLWERIQPTQNGPLSSAELARIDDVVDYARSKGMMVVLDVHNYGEGHGGALIGSTRVPDSAFADLWSKLAGYFKNDPNVMFGLMNEPNQQSATQWLQSVNAAIDAIRDAGAGQKILVPGTYWDGAWTWVSSDNDTVIGKGVMDPLNNYAFEVHQYLDSDGSGTSSNVASANVGVQRLTAATEWAQATGNQLFLGEFGVAQNSTSLQALDNMLNYMHQHQDVWLGATYWAGGPWWGNYMFSIEVANGVDKPQMDILEKYL